MKEMYVLGITELIDYLHKEIYPLCKNVKEETFRNIDGNVVLHITMSDEDYENVRRIKYKVS